MASSITFRGNAEDDGLVVSERPVGELEILDFETLNEVIMAINVTDRGDTGCAYYVAREEKLYFMEDLQLGGADVVDSRKSPRNFTLGAIVKLTRGSQGLHQPDRSAHQYKVQ